jgi:4-amino-4-deoxy-L-arabinose transferase-like glycosyltransferase
VAIIDLELTRAPERADPRLRGWRLASLFTALGLLLHLPGLLRSDVLNPDEGFLATQANVLNAGGQLYHQVVDRKPPLVPLLYATTFKLVGTDNLLSVRLLAVVAHVIAAVLLAAIARRRWSDAAGLAAGLLYLVASVGFLPADGQAANFEVFMVPFTCAAIYLASREYAPGAGSSAMAAFATLAKQVGGATMLPVAWWAWQRDGRRGVLRAALWFVAPIALAALWFGTHDFVSWVFNDSNGYLDPSGSWLTSIRRGVVWTLIFIAANLGAAMLLAPAWLRRRDDVDLWLWLLGAAIGVSAGLRFFGHYYLQLAPPLVLLAAGALHHAKPVVWARTALLGTLSVIVFLAIAVSTEPAILRPIDRLTTAIEARTAATDSIFVWGEVPQLYWSTHRAPSTRFLTVGFLTGYSGGRANTRIGEQYAVDGAWDDLQADLAANPPALIVDESSGTPFALSKFPTMQRYILGGYHPIAIVDGAVLYARGSA